MANPIIEPLKAIRRKYLKRKKEWDIKREFAQRYKGAERNLRKVAKSRDRAERSLLIGPTNAAGQATAWSRALKKEKINADSLRVVSDLDEVFDADWKIPRQSFIKWQDRANFAKEVVNKYNCILLESARPLFGLRIDGRNLTPDNFLEDLRLLRKLKIPTGVIFHGSDIRDLEYHRKMNSFSPFHQAKEQMAQVAAVGEKAAANRGVISAVSKMNVPIFITTPDLFHEIPNAIWLPVTVDWEKFDLVARQKPAFHHEGPIKVLYLPSKSWIKSSEIIIPVLEKLNSEGIIDWIKSEPVSHSEVPELMAKADVVIDQFLGIVGVLPCEAMAAGRLVLTHLAKWANEKLPQLPPVIDITPTSLESVLRNLKPNSELVLAGRAYVKRWHDGSESAKRLKESVVGY
jgi:hypothetical protein